MANVHAVANFFLHLAEDQSNHETGDLMTDLKLQKMLYFAQCWHLVRYGKPLFDSRIEAWEHGPVVPVVYSEYKQYGRKPLKAKPVDYEQFTSEEMDTMMDVFAFYGKYSASGLRELSHQFGSPWAEVYNSGVQHIEITTEAMKAYCEKQPPLETTADRILRTIRDNKIEVIKPTISKNGHPVLPADDYEDWGNWDDN